MTRRVQLTTAAHNDLTTQATYLAINAGLGTARRFYQSAEEVFQLIARQPGMGRRAHFRHPLLAGVRMFPLRRFTRYLVFYRPYEERVEIVRVIHGARDIERLFEG